MQVPKDWLGFIESLNSNGVEYLIVGAVALAFHGVPRYTGDLDVLIRHSPGNAQRLEAVLDGFGFGSLGLKAADFIDSYQVIQLGTAPVRIDLLTSLTGVTFDQAWADKVDADFGDTRAHFIGWQSLIRHKKATDQAQDRADLEVLEADE